jgi:hypothetical protein
MPHESTVKHDEVMSGNMEESVNSAYGRRYSFAQQLAKKSMSGSLSEGTATLKPVLERQKSMETGMDGVSYGTAAGHIRRTYPETPAEFTQTIDVYDDDDSADAAVAAAARLVRSGEEEDSSESGNRTPLELYKSVNSSFDRLEADSLSTIEHP